MKTHTHTPKYTRSSAAKSFNKGFTLVEIMVALVVLGILIAVGVPGMQDTIRNGRLTAQTNATLGMLSYARSEAAKQPGVTITVCASETIEMANPACDTNNWEEGWFIFSDANGDRVLNNISEDVNGDGLLDPGEDLNGNGILDLATDDVLRIGGELAGGNTMRIHGFPNLGFIQLDSNGIPGSAGTFTICDPRGAGHAKAIIMSGIGHVRVASDDIPRDFIVNNHEGVNVTCP